MMKKSFINSKKTFKFSLAILALFIVMMLLGINELAGFFIIALVFLFLFSLVYSIKSLHEPNSIKKISGLTLTGIYTILVLFLIGSGVLEFYNSFYTDENEQFEVKDNCVQSQLNFPDTVAVNKTTHGKILYKSCLDTVLNFQNRKITFLILPNNQKLEGNITKKTAQFYANESGEIDFDIKFAKIGINHIDGLLLTMFQVFRKMKKAELQTTLNLQPNKPEFTKTYL